jgi:phytoene synthase
VGLMMAKILNVKNQNALKSAIDLGIAMQLTNISRDVVEDAKNNRSYI